MENDHFRMRELVKAHRKINDEKTKDHSKENLKRHINKKFDTAIIGILDRFEKAFGDLWGIGIPESELSDDQYEIRQEWIALRKDVLDHGNNQRRAALLEVDNYTITYNKKTYNFTIRDKKD